MCGGDDAAKVRIERDFHGQHVVIALIEGAPGPEDDAVLIRIARCHALGIKRAILSPCDAGGRGGRSRRPDADDPQGCGACQKLSTIHLTLPPCVCRWFLGGDLCQGASRERSNRGYERLAAIVS